ncbi:DUF2929 family protein [Lactiplantibacillus mudanjiangensis]|uniref:DUF2929 domain-containing protein n=1 Tax=Lactiplantibacillus mudanjiangensis TaxID=1296538 RepID=A0A660E5J2_9LACO|nr:DUF2929 family protein [Lactiplantibacillus mudanjiangensis]VDG18967.1 hypothetical protein MUDAN_BIHEEGNE_00867 [Lactiplantibacillus mudanjiangensis]VDG25257.1 hypothetical protein MUDAN_IGPPGNFN_00997 [Lactiplantibacillus mudanjiangensis]VDG27489.1 hypothetical protein MUDAN_MDHGFNIF_02352 [Lactiplantibacillus mudanjiangensis]VDG33066.1 hypothetical protein MUDAN_DOGOELCO_02274 [Lactiplantibacillus mudanjiangensis]
MSKSHWFSGTIITAFWGAIFGLVIGYIGDQIVSATHQTFTLQLGTSAVVGVILALLVVFGLYPMLGHREVK